LGEGRADVGTLQIVADGTSRRSVADDDAFGSHRTLSNRGSGVTGEGPKFPFLFDH